MSDEGKHPAIVLLYGCPLQVDAHFDYDDQYSRLLFDSLPFVFRYQREEIGNWWTLDERTPFSEGRHHYIARISEYLVTVIQADPVMDRLGHYDGWQNDVKLIVLGPDFHPQEDVVRDIFAKLFPNASAFPLEHGELGTLPLWQPGSSSASPPPNRLLAQPVTDLLFQTTHIPHRLMNQGVTTVADLVGKTELELRAINGIGSGSVSTINRVLALEGLRLAS